VWHTRLTPLFGIYVVCQTDGEVEEVAELFGIKDGSGKTALELAEDNKDSCAEVVDLLKAVGVVSVQTQRLTAVK
jgi:hypothetical protein